VARVADNPTLALKGGLVLLTHEIRLFLVGRNLAKVALLGTLQVTNRVVPNALALFVAVTRQVVANMHQSENLICLAWLLVLSECDRTTKQCTLVEFRIGRPAHELIIDAVVRGTLLATNGYLSHNILNYLQKT
jgi:hypothetical protein